MCAWAYPPSVTVIEKHLRNSILSANLSQTIGVILRGIGKAASLLRIPYGNRTLPSASATNPTPWNEQCQPHSAFSVPPINRRPERRTAGPYSSPLSIVLTRTLAYPPHIHSVFSHTLFFVPIFFGSIHLTAHWLTLHAFSLFGKPSSRIGTVGHIRTSRAHSFVQARQPLLFTHEIRCAVSCRYGSPVPAVRLQRHLCFSVYSIAYLFGFVNGFLTKTSLYTNKIFIYYAYCTNQMSKFEIFNIFHRSKERTFSARGQNAIDKAPFS